MSYVLKCENIFLDVCSLDVVVVLWAKYHDCNKKNVCMKYDDVGVCVGQVDMGKTREAGKVVMMDLLN